MGCEDEALVDEIKAPDASEEVDEDDGVEVVRMLYGVLKMLRDELDAAEEVKTPEF